MRTYHGGVQGAGVQPRRRDPGLNDEGQYSLWPADLEVPAGWRPDGTTGSRDECSAHVDEVWTDM